MKISVSAFLDYYKTNYCFYSIEIYLISISEEEFKTLFEKFRYYSRKNKCSCLAVLSDTESKTAVPTTEHNGKVGRPRKRVEGIKTDAHIHSLVTGNHAYSTAQQISRAINKRYGKKVTKVESKGDGLRGYNYIKYSMRQENMYRTCGDFDFFGYVADHGAFDDMK